MASNMTTSSPDLCLNYTNSSCPVEHRTTPDLSLSVFGGIMVVTYGLMCIVGLIGNGLVVFVILRYTKMKTVTNMYILNLSIADFLFMGLLADADDNRHYQTLGIWIRTLQDLLHPDVH